jgi:hypothetical protein
VSEGSVYQRKDGRYVAEWQYSTGKWCYLYRKTKAEAKQALRQALKGRDEGIVPASKMTLNDLLASWLEDMQVTVSRRTLENRQCAVTGSPCTYDRHTTAFHAVSQGFRKTTLPG